jgi:hypothetical protein
MLNPVHKLADMVQTNMTLLSPSVDLQMQQQHAGSSRSVSILQFELADLTAAIVYTAYIRLEFPPATPVLVYLGEP